MDALREAAFEYQDLMKLEKRVSSFVDDPKLPCEVALKKMYSLLEKYEPSFHASMYWLYEMLQFFHLIIKRSVILFSGWNKVYMLSYVQGTWLFHGARSLEFQLIGYWIQELLARYASKLRRICYFLFIFLYDCCMSFGKIKLI